MKFTYFTLLTTTQAIELRRVPASSPVALHMPSLAQLGMKIQESASNDGSCSKDADCGVSSWGETERCATTTMQGFSFDQCINEILCGETYEFDDGTMSYDCFDGGNNVAAIPNTEAGFEATATDIAHAEEDATNDAEVLFTEEVGYCVRQSDGGYDDNTQSSATTSDDCKAACAEDISCIAAVFYSGYYSG